MIQNIDRVSKYVMLGLASIQLQRPEPARRPSSRCLSWLPTYELRHVEVLSSRLGLWNIVKWLTRHEIQRRWFSSSG